MLNDLMRRPRVDALLEKAFEKPVVTLVAGPGCGKTCAVNSYLHGSGINALWVQLSEADNQPARFWENFTRAISLGNGAVTEKLRKLELPSSQAGLLRVTDLITDEIMPRYRHALVFDDLHLIQNTAVLWFIRAFAYGLASGRLERYNEGDSIVLISRENCGLDSASLLAEGRVAQIGEQELNFTKSEAMDFFRFLGVAAAPAQRDDLEAIYGETEGWPFLLNVAGTLLLKHPDRVKYIRGALRHNVTMIIENELFLHNSPEMNKFLTKLSLVNCLAADFISRFENGGELIRELTRHSSLVRYDVYMNAYHIHHLAQDFLRGQQKLLTEEEKRWVYAAAAQWCIEHDLKMDAADYYARAGDYKAVVGIIYQFPQIIPFDKAALLFEILDGAPPALAAEILSLHSYRGRLLLSLGRIDQAVEEMRAVIQAVEPLEDTPDHRRKLMGAYHILGTARMLTCRDTGVYDFAEYFRKADAYAQGSGFAPVGSMRVATLAPYTIRIGRGESGEPEKYIRALEKTIPYAAHLMDGCMTGLDDLARAELAYYRVDIAGCRRFAMQALFKAQKKKQYEIENGATFFLMKAGLASGKYKPIKEAMQQIEEQLGNPGFLNRYISYDIQMGWFYGSIGQKEHVADWLKSDFSVSHAPTVLSNYEDIARAKYYLSEQDYGALLAMLSSRTGGFDITHYLFGQIGLEVYRAIGLFNLKDMPGAMETLRRAYELAAPNRLNMVFVEQGNHMRTLAAAALKQPACGIPSAWLETIQTKAATYAKRVAQVRSQYRLETGLDGSTQLTNKETELLTDLSHGLSRTEIASARSISINTVKMMLQYIYEKLGAENSMDAVRLAFAKGLL